MKPFANSRQWLLVLGLALSLGLPQAAFSQGAPQASRKPISEAEILDLLQAGVSPSRAADLVNQMGIDFLVTPEVEQRLRSAGATDELLEAIRKRSVASPQAGERFEQGRRLFQQGDYAGALKEFEEAEKLAPRWAEVHAERAAALDATENYVEAALAWKRYVQLAPTASDRKQVEERIQEKIRALVRKGFDAYTTQRFGEPEGDNAIFWARQVRRVEPDHPTAKELENRAAIAWENEAKLALSQQQFEAARQIYQKLAAVFPENSAYPAALAAIEKQGKTAAQLARAQQAFNAGQYGEPPGENAIELSRQILQADPENASARDLEVRAVAAYEGLARRAVEGNDRKRAVEIYLRLASLFPARGEYRQRASRLQTTDILAVHYHGMKRRMRFPLPVKFEHKGCWGTLRLSPQGVQFVGTGGNDARVDNFSVSLQGLRGGTAEMGRPGALDDNFAASGIHMTNIITLSSGKEAKFYVSTDAVNAFRAYSAEFWGWKWETRVPTKRRVK